MSKNNEEYENIAYDVSFSHKKKVYNLVTIGYNSSTKEGKVIKIEPIADSRMMAIQAAKKAIVDRVLAINIDLKPEVKDE